MPTPELRKKYIDEAYKYANEMAYTPGTNFSWVDLWLMYFNKKYIELVQNELKQQS